MDKRVQGPKHVSLAHCTYGFNPCILKLTGIHNDDERLFGSVTFGFGTQGSIIGGPGWRTAAHTDCGILNPSVYLDDVAIERARSGDQRTREPAFLGISKGSQ